MSFHEHPPDDGRGLVGDVLIDQEERRLHLLPSKHVQKVRRRRRIWTVIVGQIHGGWRTTWHVPHGTIASHGVQDESGRRDVGQSNNRQSHDSDNPHFYTPSRTSEP